MIFAVVEVTDYNNNAQLEWHVISTIIHELLQNVDQARTLFDNEKISVKYVVNSNMLPVHFTEVLKEEIILNQSGI